MRQDILRMIYFCYRTANFAQKRNMAVLEAFESSTPQGRILKMDKKRKLQSIAAVVIALVLFFAGIATEKISSEQRSSASKNYEYDSVSDSAGDTYVLESDESAEESAELYTKGAENQKIVYTGTVEIGTDSIDKSYKKVTETMKEHEATFESVSDSSTSKTMVIRVPKDKFISMYESLSEVGGNITYSNVSMTDMTKTYTDNARRLDILQTEYKELKELMGTAKTVQDILSIKDRMTELTYEMEQLKGSNDDIDYDSNFSRLEVTLHLAGGSSPVSFGYQIKEAFIDGINMIKNLFLLLVELWWVILIGVGIFVFIKKRHKKGKNAISKAVTGDVAEEIRQDIAAEENTQDVASEEQ